MKCRSTFDKVAWGAVVVLALFVGGMMMGGDFTQPRIHYFNGYVGDISPQAGQFLFRFNRLMDEKSIEKGFQIVPAVKGNFSWSGRTFAFTATEPLRYDQYYTISLKGARDRQGKNFEDTILQAHSMSRSLFFLDDQGKMNQLFFPEMKSLVLTAENLFVQQFSASPTGDMVAFLATPRSGGNMQDRSSFRLYILNTQTKKSDLLAIPSGLILDNLTWMPDGSGVAYTFIDMQSSKEGIAWYDLSSKRVVEIAPNKARAYKFSFTPDGSNVIYMDTNGALILGDIVDGNGALVATTSNDLVGFDNEGKYVAYIAPKSVDVFDLNNVPILVDSAGDERKIPVPDSTSFDMQFFPQSTKIVWTLERDLGNQRPNALYTYDYEKDLLSPIVEKVGCSAVHPQVSPDEAFLTWLCIANENKGYVLTGWNDYQGKIVTGEIWTKDLLTGEERNLGMKGANVEWGK